MREKLAKHSRIHQRRYNEEKGRTFSWIVALSYMIVHVFCITFITFWYLPCNKFCL